MLLINSKLEDKNHHLKLMIFSWSLLAICVVVIPLIVIFSALVPEEKRFSKEFKKRFGMLYENYKTSTINQRLFRIQFCIRRLLFVFISLYCY